MENLTIKLKEMVIVNEDIYDELVFKKFKAKHYKYLPDELFDLEYDDPENMSRKQSNKLTIACFPLMAALAEVPLEVIEELSPIDLMEVAEKFAPFLEKSLSQGTGKS